MVDSPVSYFSDTEVGEEEESECGSEKEEEEQIPPPLSGEASSPSAAAYPSVCTPSTAENCAVVFKVPPEFDLRAPTAAQRAHAPPPGYAAIYIHHFQFGLRLPLPPFVVSLLDHYRIALAQLYPVSVFYILGFMEICRKVSISPTMILFRHFFRLKKSIRTVGWYTFHICNRSRIVYGQPSGVHGWKEAFLFFKTAPLSAGNVRSLSPWNHSSVVDMPVADSERPSKQVVSKFLANVKRFPRGASKWFLLRGSSKRASVPPLESEGIFIYSCLVYLAANND